MVFGKFKDFNICFFFKEFRKAKGGLIAYRLLFYSLVKKRFGIAI
jgi:hypothetical protein